MFLLASCANNVQGFILDAALGNLEVAIKLVVRCNPALMPAKLMRRRMLRMHESNDFRYLIAKGDRTAFGHGC